MADYTKIVTAIEIKLNALIGRPAVIQFENTTVTLPNTGLALETFLLPAQTVYTTLGVNAKGNESGVYQINVIAQTNIGRGAALTLAQTLRDYFHRGLYLTLDTTVTRIEKSILGPGFISNSKYKIPVSIYYLSYS